MDLISHSGAGAGACECALPGASSFVSHTWSRAVETAAMPMRADTPLKQLTLALPFTITVPCAVRVCAPLTVTMRNDDDEYPATLSLAIKVINVLPPARVVSSAVPTELHLDNDETDAATLVETLTLDAGTYTAHVACAATIACTVAAYGNINVAAAACRI